MYNHSTALLLTGGGARAAYQVGVLKAITRLLPRNHRIPFAILSGTSAGAINATALACYASCYHLGVRKLEWVWKNFHSEQVYAASLSGTLRHIGRNYFSKFQSDDISKAQGSLLNNGPLRILLRRMLDFSRIDRNLHRQYLRAVSVTVSSYSTRESVSYFQGQPEQQAWQRYKRRGEPCILDVDHLLGSAAIPLIFPVVDLANDHVGDGSIHQFAPLSVPIHLGANKILVVGVDQANTPPTTAANALPQAAGALPQSATIAGHLLDNLFAETLEIDIERLQRINRTLKIMTAAQRQQSNLHHVDCMVVKPSKDIQVIAQEHFLRLPLGIRTLLKVIGIDRDSDSSLPSYLLFEDSFCRELIDLGYQDGLAQQQALTEFLEID